jgi:predicted RNase H-like nuclease (RuvC/YqgF family)
LFSQLSAAAEALASSQAESQSISRTLAARDDELKRNVDELKTTLQAKDFLAKVLLDRQNQIKEMESQDEKQKREVRELKLELDKLKGRLENSASGAAAEIETLRYIIVMFCVF